MIYLEYINIFKLLFFIDLIDLIFWGFFYIELLFNI